MKEGAQTSAERALVERRSGAPAAQGVIQCGAMREARGVPEGRWKLAGGVSHRIAEKNESAPAGALEFDRRGRSTAPPGRVRSAGGSGG